MKILLALLALSFVASADSFGVDPSVELVAQLQRMSASTAQERLDLDAAILYAQGMDWNTAGVDVADAGEYVLSAARQVQLNTRILALAVAPSDPPQCPEPASVILFGLCLPILYVLTRNHEHSRNASR